MKIVNLINLVRNRLMVLNNQRVEAFQRGDADRVAVLDTEIADTEQTLTALDSLT